MAEDFLTLDDLPTAGRTVLLRVDINSPLDPLTGRILNDARLRHHLVTLRDLRNAKVAILAHQSRPGKADYTTLEPHAERLGYLLGRRVHYVDSLFGRSAREAIEALRPGEVVLLENTRFYAEEELLTDATPERMATSQIVRTLAPLADVFVLDAFAAAHRAQPTLCGFCEVLPSVAGRVMEREVRMLTQAVEGSEGPKVALFGGIKVEDTLEVMAHMLDEGTLDRVLTGGGVASVFLAAQGVALGKGTETVLHRELDGYQGLVRRAGRLLADHGDRILAPTDVVLNAAGEPRPARVADLPADEAIYDVGIDTIARYVRELASAGTVLVNGPPGVFELEPFSVGTRELFTAAAEAEAFTVAGGGHTVAALERLALEDRFDHVSTGGGALISFLSGRPLPLLDALRRSREKFADVARA